MKYSAFIIVASLFVTSVVSSKEGKRCYSNKECTGRLEYCKINSPTCGSGTCSCIPGYLINSETGKCGRGVEVKDKCGYGDVCITPNSICLEGKCTCVSTYKPGIYNNTCVPNLNRALFDQTCRDTVECYNNMVCLTNNKCGCYEGYSRSTKLGFQQHCIVNTLGSPCFSDDACPIRNGMCIGNKCDCMAGFRMITYSNKTLQTACVREDVPLGLEGDVCDAEKGVYCNKKFTCVKCDKDLAPKICGYHSQIVDAAVSIHASVFTLCAATILFWGI